MLQQFKQNERQEHYRLDSYVTLLIQQQQAALKQLQDQKLKNTLLETQFNALVLTKDSQEASSNRNYDLLKLTYDSTLKNYEALHTQHAVSLDQLANLNRENKDLRQSIRRLQSELQVIRRELQTKSSTVANQNHLNARLQEEISLIKNENIRITDEFQRKIEPKLLNTAKQRDNMQQQLNRLAKLLAESEKILAIREEEVKRLQLNNSNLNQNIMDLEQSHHQLSSVNKSKVEIIEQLQHSEHQKIKEIRQLLQIIDILQRSHKKLYNDLSAALSCQKELKIKNSELVADIQAEMKRASSLSECQIQLNDLSISYKTKAAQLLDVLADLQTMKVQNAKLRCEISQVRDCVSAQYQKEIVLLIQEIQSLKHRRF